MNVLVFINIGDMPMTEETMFAKISRVSLFHGGTLDRSPDNKSVWIIQTELSRELKKHYTRDFWKWFGDGICKLFDTPVYVSIYVDNKPRYPKFKEKRNIEYVSKVQEPLFDFSGDDISIDPRFW